jgi:hypothetical protein
MLISQLLLGDPFEAELETCSDSKSDQAFVPTLKAVAKAKSI